MPRAVDGSEDAPRVLEKRRARGEEIHSARRTNEERGADLVLERTDLPAHGGLGHMKALRRPTDVTLLGDGNEVADLRETHDSSVPSPALRCK